MEISGTAFAATNPYVDRRSDKTTGLTDAVAKLSQADIVAGYADGTFKDDKTRTRYSMAQIVAKAMARSDKADAVNNALIEKLVAKYKAQLETVAFTVSHFWKKTAQPKIYRHFYFRLHNKDLAPLPTPTKTPTLQCSSALKELPKSIKKSSISLIE